jgi:Mn2+/Fe2+ NRAMP family transporter
MPAAAWSTGQIRRRRANQGPATRKESWTSPGGFRPTTLTDETVDSMTPTHIRTMRLDVIAGASSGALIMFVILVATAVTLGAHPTTIETADQAAQALRPLAGDLAGLLFAA